jgi:precorrin-2/cobalt-factor-2 C20-methyltransferase
MAKFYGIGVGPGDPELLTIKAAKVLETVDVLLIPETQKGKEGVAYHIIASYLKPDIRKEYIHFPMVTDERVFDEVGKEAANIVTKEVEADHCVAFVTLGDPSVYSTYGYIIKQIPKHIEIETIPGITSFCAAAAMANRPLVEKKEIFSIIPMNASEEKINEIAEKGDSFAFMKVYRQNEKIINILKQHQLEEESVLVRRCGFEDATVQTNVIGGLEQSKEYLSVILSRKEKK